MSKRGYRSTVTVLAVLALMLGATWCWAQTPQTIVIDGINDFDPSNLIDADGGDTQFPNIDLGDIYLTNDAVSLYYGFDQDPDGWGIIQLGIAIDINNTPAGGDTDPWGRQIEWTLAPNKPDYMFYVNLDNNWQAGYEWDGANWVAFAEGPNSLGWVTSTGFKELGILLCPLGVFPSDEINTEIWVTQDSPTKGPLDLMVDDVSQLSSPGFTLWDTTTPIPLTLMYNYTIQVAADPDPPVVTETRPNNDFPAESFFDVYFNEPIDPVTAQTVGNYTISGGDGGVHNVVVATWDANLCNVVHIEVAPPMTASANLYQVTVVNVEDLASNVIVNNGVTNVACFMLKHALFRGRFSHYLATNSDPPDTFTVEGALDPVTWALCDNAFMTDTLVDDIWEWENIFHIGGDCAGGTASASMEWKFVHECSTYEPLANRHHTFDLAGGASDTLDFWWNDEDPTQFILSPVDVEFFVDMNLFGFAPGDTVGVNGSELPLTWNVPTDNEMVDDGSGNDAAPGDGVYSTVVRFPTGTRKNVDFKYILNSLYECLAEGNRNVYLNDADFDTVGGANGPITLPKGYFDRCHTTWGDVEVVFRVDFNNTAWENIAPDDTASVNGTPSNGVPVTFNWDIPSLNPMRDDGVYPDDTSGDKIYSTSVIFADSSWANTEYKYLFNSEYECLTQSNRTFWIDADTYDAVGNPQILPIDEFQRCSIVGVTQLPRKTIALDQNRPNPFNPMTEIRFVVPRAGRGSLRVYNLRGELVRTLLSGQIQAGESTVMWNGRADDGQQVSSGIYFYRLQVDNEIDVKSMMLLK